MKLEALRNRITKAIARGNKALRVDIADLTAALAECRDEEYERGFSSGYAAAKSEKGR